VIAPTNKKVVICAPVWDGRLPAGRAAEAFFLVFISQVVSQFILLREDL
jgi:hypothetical protein